MYGFLYVLIATTLSHINLKYPRQDTYAVG
uniref:Uncharacterized protein n=1 Tax=Anguilla anguilla TaxID=7936 RepID=A0A0E9PW34_ANGAN